MNALLLGLRAADTYTAAEKECMLELARFTLGNVVADGPERTGEGLLPRLLEKRGCFVTLTKGGLLRGCVGRFLPETPLYRAIIQNVRQAALGDPRFPPVEAMELKQVRIEISVLTKPQRIDFSSVEELLGKLSAGTDGVVLQIGDHVATFLPQVWEQMRDKETFLDRLAQKAGCPPWTWRDKGAAISVYHADSFAEPDARLEVN